MEDIDAFYKQYEPDLKHATLLWRIYKLIQAKVLERKGRGKYALGSAKPYEPFVDLPLKRLYQQLTGTIPFCDAYGMDYPVAERVDDSPAGVLLPTGGN